MQIIFIDDQIFIIIFIIICVIYTNFETYFLYLLLILLSGTLQPRGRRPLARAGVAFSQKRDDGRAGAHQAGPEAQVGHPARIAAQLVHPAGAVAGQTRKGKAHQQNL
jgi:hypothetical protein